METVLPTLIVNILTLAHSWSTHLIVASPVLWIGFLALKFTPVKKQPIAGYGRFVQKPGRANAKTENQDDTTRLRTGLLISGIVLMALGITGKFAPAISTSVSEAEYCTLLPVLLARHRHKTAAWRIYKISNTNPTTGIICHHN